MNINKRVLVKYELTIETGLHIGGCKDVYGIGGVDSPVIKNPMNNEPIIPGSSIKGKVRSLLEVVSNNINLINKAFGKVSTKNETGEITRVIFRDLNLTSSSSKELQLKLGEGFFTEIKAENSIQKSTGTALSPRFIERVPAGAVFSGEYVINYLDGDKEGEFEALLTEGFELLKNNYLGGNGTRGYGKVDYKEISKTTL